jgi:hypothetical protein
MQKLKLVEQETFSYQTDVERIVEIFAERGYEISATDAETAWQRYSDSMCAGWMDLDDEDAFVFSNCFYYFKEWN